MKRLTSVTRLSLGPALSNGVHRDAAQSASSSIDWESADEAFA